MQVFAPGEELEEAHAVGGAIHPGSGVGRAVDEGADGLLPVIAVFEALAFEVVAAGKAEKFGMQGGEFFHEVGTETIGLIVPGGREEREEREPGGAGVRDEKFEVVVGGGLESGGGFQGEEVGLQELPRAGTMAEAAMAPVWLLTRRTVMGPRLGVSERA